MKNGVFIFEDFEPNIIKFKVFDQSNNTVIKCGENSISIRNIKFDFIIYTGTNISKSYTLIIKWDASSRWPFGPNSDYHREDAPHSTGGSKSGTPNC